MITEDQLEQLTIQWFQDTGWSYANGADLAPEGATPERADFRTVVLKARLAAAVQRLNPKLPPAAVEESSACGHDADGDELAAEQCALFTSSHSANWR